MPFFYFDVRDSQGVNRDETGLELPDLDTRLKIVAHLAARLDAEFTPEALRYVAERFNGGVRELEGVLRHSLQRHGRRERVSSRALADMNRDALASGSDQVLEILIRDHGEGPVRLALSTTTEILDQPGDQVSPSPAAR